MNRKILFLICFKIWLFAWNESFFNFFRFLSYYDVPTAKFKFILMLYLTSPRTCEILLYLATYIWPLILTYFVIEANLSNKVRKDFHDELQLNNV